jgi:ribosomal protein S18 acetylase RimI-like enzyme
VGRGQAAAERAVGPLAAAERGAAERVLARAFRDSPLNVAVIGPDPERRLRANLHGARALLPVALAHGLVLAARAQGAPRGVLVATRPFGWPLPPPGFAASLRRVLGQGVRTARRWGQVFEALARVHPFEPHWYLATLGVDPESWGRGIGTALLARWLADVDADAVPAWLETDREGNVGFYRRAGFELALRTEVLATPVWCMRRPPSAPRASIDAGSEPEASGGRPREAAGPRPPG